MNVAKGADIIGFRIIKGGHGDEHGGEADQAVEGGDQLRQGGHLDLDRHHGADGAADQHAQQNHREADDARVGQCRNNGDDHAGNAVHIPLAGRFRGT